MKKKRTAVVIVARRTPIAAKTRTPADTTARNNTARKKDVARLDRLVLELRRQLGLMQATVDALVTKILDAA